MLLLTSYQKGDAISQSEIFHNPHSIFYVNPGAGQTKLRAKRDCIQGAHAVIGTERVLMMVEYGDENFDTGYSQRLRFSIDLQSYRILRREI